MVLPTPMGCRESRKGTNMRRIAQMGRRYFQPIARVARADWRLGRRPFGGYNRPRWAS